MKIEHWNVEDSKDLVHVYNEQLKDTPYFYTVSLDEFQDGIRNRINQENNSVNLHSEKIIIGEQDSKILGFAHVSIGEMNQFGQAKNGGFIHFLTYQSGYRPIGQAILEECEKYLHDLGASQIWAFLHTSSYRFYHLGFGYISDKIGHVLGLFRMNKYEIDLGEIFMSYPQYEISEPKLPDNEINIEVSQNPSSGKRPSLHIQATRNGEKIGECATVSAGEFYYADDAQDWFFTKWLGIEEKEQGKKLGQYLLQRTFWEMRKIGYKSAIISTNINNYRAQLCYTNFGYQVIDTGYGLVKKSSNS
jgi:GNAT superfamily N-acetyltransferase